ncbi:hypothetical protein [Micromonospora sp. KC207]|uniref:hypothetical protein n=1 Tax=Micromonospora sp. KC207 TaxID=2530377 RepID=UPI001FB630A1|nr:hypothetical protein [Micromonospora sp. KC207]
MNGGAQVSRDGRDWRIGAAADVSWIAGHTTAGVSITTAMPPVFGAYATTCQADDVTAAAYEQALIEGLSTHTPDQPWWLAYLDTGAHDIVFPHAPRARSPFDEDYPCRSRRLAAAGRFAVDSLPVRTTTTTTGQAAADPRAPGRRGGSPG